MALSSKSVDDTPALETFVSEWIARFKNPPLHSVTGDRMWKIFSEDFAKFTEDQFMNLNSVRKYGLKCFLCQRGVYINEYSSGFNNTLGAVLYECAQRQEPHEWTADDLHRYLKMDDIPYGWLENEFENNRLRRSTSHPPILSPTSRHNPSPFPPPGSQLYEQKIMIAQQDNNYLPQKQSDLRSYSKEMVRLFRLYKEEHKYDGLSTGPFDYRLIVFYGMCDLAGVPPEAYLKVFFVMLKGIALSFHLNYQATRTAELTFADVCDNMRRSFEGPYYKQSIREKWHRTTLQTVISENPTKSTFECFHILVDKLQILQYGLSHDMRDVATLQDKITASCRNTPASGWNALGSLTDSGNAISRAHPGEPDTSSTDRRFHSNTTKER